MSSATAEGAIDFLFEQCQEDFLAITFFGGEPLLKRPLIEQVIARVKHNQTARPDLKVRYAVNTNGTLLDEPSADLLRRERDRRQEKRRPDQHTWFPTTSQHVCISAIT